MPQHQYNQQRYNPLGAESEDTMQVQVDSVSYHEIRIYNGTKDALWQMLGLLTNKMGLEQIAVAGNEIYIILLRADSIWKGIEAGAVFKSERIRIQRQSFKYENQFLKLSSDIERYVDFIRNPIKFTNEFGDVDEDFKQYLSLNVEGKVEFMKKKVVDIVRNADNIWGTLASKIGFGMPLKIAEESDMFFRGG